jgi:hypothetical protein
LDISLGSISAAFNAFPWGFSAGFGVMLVQLQRLDTITSRQPYRKHQQ